MTDHVEQAWSMALPTTAVAVAVTVTAWPDRSIVGLAASAFILSSTTWLFMVCVAAAVAYWGSGDRSDAGECMGIGVGSLTWAWLLTALSMAWLPRLLCATVFAIGAGVAFAALGHGLQEDRHA